MTRSTLATAVLAAGLVLFAAGQSMSAEARKPVGGAPASQAPREPGTSELRWTPLPDKWVACTVNGQKCRCSGDVVDCRAATGDKAPVKAQ